MKISPFTLGWLLCAVWFSGCFGPGMLQTSLNNKRVAVGYLHDSPKAEEKLPIQITSTIVDSSGCPYSTTVVKDSGRFLYAVVFYDKKNHYTVTLGKASVEPNFPKFLRESLAGEMERSGAFLLDDSSATQRWTPEVKVETFSSKAYYLEEGLGIPHGSVYYAQASPLGAELSVLAQLRDETGALQFERRYQHREVATFVRKRTSIINTLNKDLMVNLSESSATCVKVVWADLVADLNEVLRAGRG